MIQADRVLKKTAYYLPTPKTWTAKKSESKIIKHGKIMQSYWVLSLLSTFEFHTKLASNF